MRAARNAFPRFDGRVEYVISFAIPAHDRSNIRLEVTGASRSSTVRRPSVRRARVLVLHPIKHPAAGTRIAERLAPEEPEGTKGASPGFMTTPREYMVGIESRRGSGAGFGREARFYRAT